MADDFDSLALTQRYKAAIHYTTGKICEEVAAGEEDVRFTKQFMAAMSEATFKYIQTLSTDLELFAKHARRSVVNSDDVKICVRKSPTLLGYLTAQCPVEEKRPKKKSTAKKRGKSAANDVEEDNEESNMGDG